MDRAQLADWVARYESAWRSPGTEALAGLFTPDATYSTRPYETPHRGLAAIARMWEAERLAGEQFDISTEIVAVESDTGVARIEVRYHRPREQEYRDLWIVRLDDSGQCFHFEEWPFWPPGSEGASAAGA
jgi:SnoaL-like domain